MTDSEMNQENSEQSAPAKKSRKPRSDAGKPRGSRKSTKTAGPVKVTELEREEARLIDGLIRRITESRYGVPKVYAPDSEAIESLARSIAIASKVPPFNYLQTIAARILPVGSGRVKAAGILGSLYSYGRGLESANNGIANRIYAMEPMIPDVPGYSKARAWADAMPGEGPSPAFPNFTYRGADGETVVGGPMGPIGEERVISYAEATGGVGMEADAMAHENGKRRVG